MPNEKSRSHFNGGAGARDCTRRGPEDKRSAEGTGYGEANVDPAANARRPARSSRSMNQQHRDTLAAAQRVRRERIFYESGIGGSSEAAKRSARCELC